MGNKLHRQYEYQGEVVYAFRCLGCKGRFHEVRLEGPYAWMWNRSMDKPSIMPSIKTTYWEDGGGSCHSYIKDGKIQYLNDSCHELKGQTIELPDWWDD